MANPTQFLACHANARSKRAALRPNPTKTSKTQHCPKPSICLHDVNGLCVVCIRNYAHCSHRSGRPTQSPAPLSDTEPRHLGEFSGWNTQTLVCLHAAFALRARRQIEPARGKPVSCKTSTPSDTLAATMAVSNEEPQVPLALCHRGESCCVIVVGRRPSLSVFVNRPPSPRSSTIARCPSSSSLPLPSTRLLPPIVPLNNRII